jgi:hypothetical protein
MVSYQGTNLLQNNAISDGVYIPSIDVLQNNVTSALMVVLKVPVLSRREGLCAGQA